LKQWPGPKTCASSFVEDEVRIAEILRTSTDDELESNAIPVHIHHLRRKLVDAGAAAEIHTVRGLGYLMTETKA
jgi:DNA-binding response OmpR family regulator